MNPGKLNHRLRFSQEVSAQNSAGGYSVSEIAVICSDTAPTDTTWGSVEPIKQWNQQAMEAGANVFNGDRMIVIRWRGMFTPTKSMLIYDLNNPGDVYTVHSLLPFDPGTKAAFQNNQQVTYKDQKFVFILGKKRV